ncbi:MAG: toprim domain-containing protein [Patescibacteria group bacterium]
MDPISKLTEYFREFPGIGPRQARRFVYFLLTRNAAHLEDMSRLILDIKKSIRICSSCFRFYQDGKTTMCPICSNASRDASQLMIVSRDVDFEAIEKSKVYNGFYFILGGTIPILDKEPEKKVRLKELTDKIKKNQYKEIILSLNANAEGEHTAEFIRSYLKDKFPSTDFSVSVLGRGLSTGTELEYSDTDTIKNALKNREKI